MNWTKFLLNLTLIYLLYYSVNVLIDFLKLRKDAVGNSLPDSDTLFFSDDIVPTLVELEAVDPEPPPVHQPVNQQKEESERGGAMPLAKFESTGGVPIKDIWGLARADLIHYTKGIHYE